MLDKTRLIERCKDKREFFRVRRRKRVATDAASEQVRESFWLVLRNSPRNQACALDKDGIANDGRRSGRSGRFRSSRVEAQNVWCERSELLPGPSLIVGHRDGLSFVGKHPAFVRVDSNDGWHG